MKYTDILYEMPSEHILLITLNQPESLNAYTPTMMEDLMGAFEQAWRDDDVRVVVITGAGRGFCAGADTRKMGESFDQTLIDQRHFLTNSVHRLLRALWAFDKPVLAAVNGPAAGFGMDLASWCDIRFASEQATFTMSYVRHGYISGAGGSYILPRLLGVSKALDLIWRGKSMNARDALACGYVMDVFPADQCMGQVLTYAKELVAGPPLAHQIAKRLVYDGLQIENPVISLHQTEHARLLIRSSEDAREGGRAASERRKPAFKGR